MRAWLTRACAGMTSTRMRKWSRGTLALQSTSTHATHPLIPRPSSKTRPTNAPETPSRWEPPPLPRPQIQALVKSPPPRRTTPRGGNHHLCPNRARSRFAARRNIIQKGKSVLFLTWPGTRCKPLDFQGGINGKHLRRRTLFI